MAGWFVAGYLLITVVNSALTLLYTAVEQTPSAPQLGVSYLHDPAYQATVGWHPLVALVVWSACAYLMWRRVRPGRREAWSVALVWLAVNAVVDLVGYVLVLGDTRWGLPAADFYVHNQPWLGLTYLALVLGVVGASVAPRRGGMARRDG